MSTRLAGLFPAQDAWLDALPSGSRDKAMAELTSRLAPASGHGRPTGQFAGMRAQRTVAPTRGDPAGNDFGHERRRRVPTLDIRFIVDLQ